MILENYLPITSMVPMLLASSKTVKILLRKILPARVWTWTFWLSGADVFINSITEVYGNIYRSISRK